jgi:heat shock protein HslJ
MRCLSTLLAGASMLAFAFDARAADLGGTSWQLVMFQGSEGSTLAPDDRTKYTIAFGTDGHVSARIDCNRGAGSWKSPGPNQLQLGPLALTRAMCPPGSLYDRISRDWELVRSYTIKDGRLLLSLADGGIYQYEPKGTAPKSPVESTGPVEFECKQAGGGKDTLRATFYHTTPEMVLVERGNQTRPGFQVVAADGAKYEGRDLMFWEARGQAMVTWSDDELKCKPH